MASQQYIYHCVGCGVERTSYSKRKTDYFCNSCRIKKHYDQMRKRSGSSRLKKQLIKANGKACQRCGTKANVQMHHIVPIGKGGRTNEDNCILLCENCHREAHNGRGVGPTTLG